MGSDELPAGALTAESSNVGVVSSSLVQFLSFSGFLQALLCTYIRDTVSIFY